MLIRILIVLSSILFLSACETPEHVTTGIPGIGRGQSYGIYGSGTGAGGHGGAGGGIRTEDSRYGESSGIGSGTQEDLVAYVGDRVFFGLDSSDINAEAQAILQRQATWLKSNPRISITVEGHCDERGTREYNLALGDRRATSVRKYLISLGIEPNRVSTISYGKERPAVLGSNDAAWAENRRGVSVVNQ